MEFPQKPLSLTTVDRSSNQAHRLASRVQNFALEYVAPLLAAIVLTLVFTWPLPTYFTQSLVGDGDAMWGLGTLWYWREAVLGHEPWFYATRLYYPVGISFATNAAGPFSTLLSLPFWALGPAAAYNGAIVLGFALTGYCTYLLARDVGCSRPSAWLAGLLLMATPLHVLAVFGHLNKIFLGFIPLALVATLRAMDPSRSRYWCLAVGPMLVLAFLQAPEQFVIAGTGCIFVALYLALFGARTLARNELPLRLLWVGTSIGVCAIPLYLLMRFPGAGPSVSVDVSAQSSTYQPDLLQFLVPPGLGVLAFQKQLNQILTPNVVALVETAVYLTWGGLLLCLLAWWKNRRLATMWLLLLGVSMLLALGPTLRVYGDSWVSQLNIPLPYAVLNSLPGLAAMRTPGRFMLLGYMAFAIAAAIGMDVVIRRARPHVALGVLAALVSLVLLEVWPVPYPSRPLLPSPPFYQQIAADPERYGVLDLPVRPLEKIDFLSWHLYYSSFYQIDQMTHGKGIATGYVSRHYATHPVFAHFISENFHSISPLQADLTVDGQPSSRYANLRYYLAQNNYRYVVLHKPSVQHPIYKPGAWGENVARRLIDDVFGDQPPIVDDAMTEVYEVGSAPDASTLNPSIAMLEPTAPQGWYEYRLAQSPTGFLVHSPTPLVTTLAVKAQTINDDTGKPYDYAILTVQTGHGMVESRQPIGPEETVRVPVALSPGSQVITTTVVSSEGDAVPGMPLTIAINQIDLSTAPSTELLIPVQDGFRGQLLAAYADGWYAAEGMGDGTMPWRWAASPASVWVYSSEIQTVTLHATPVALHDAGAADGKGPAGTLAVSVNDIAAGEWPVVVGQQFAIPFQLSPGWSTVTLALAAGSFKPIDLQPESGDSRDLSFALQGLSMGH